MGIHCRCCNGEHYKIKRSIGACTGLIYVFSMTLAILTLFTIVMKTRGKSPINQIGNPGDIAGAYQIVRDWRA